MNDVLNKRLFYNSNYSNPQPFRIREKLGVVRGTGTLGRGLELG